jgi:hypothetical protein
LKGDPLRILAELRLMGIHAGSMFPGMDGVCRSLAERYATGLAQPVLAVDVSGRATTVASG